MVYCIDWTFAAWKVATRLCVGAADAHASSRMRCICHRCCRVCWLVCMHGAYSRYDFALLVSCHPCCRVKTLSQLPWFAYTYCKSYRYRGTAMQSSAVVVITNRSGRAGCVHHVSTLFTLRCCACGWQTLYNPVVHAKHVYFADHIYMSIY